MVKVNKVPGKFPFFVVCQRKLGTIVENKVLYKLANQEMPILTFP